MTAETDGFSLGNETAACTSSVSELNEAVLLNTDFAALAKEVSGVMDDFFDKGCFLDLTIFDDGANNPYFISQEKYL